MPPVIERIAEERRGLILVTGATGSGKSTTLAAMIDCINSTRGGHIVTIEDPIEFLQPRTSNRLLPSVKSTLIHARSQKRCEVHSDKTRT